MQLECQECKPYARFDSRADVAIYSCMLIQLFGGESRLNKPLITSKQRVLENPNNWMVHTMALLLRSRLEGGKSRTVERAALQLQALVDQFPLTDSPVSERMHHFFSIMLPPKWELEGELGERFVSLGVTRSALEIFERLEMWDNVISCYQMLEQEKKAEAVVLERLKVSPESPKLHCILGDLRKEPALYEKAWKLSDGRYARAMRSLGAHYFRQAEVCGRVWCFEIFCLKVVHWSHSVGD